MQRALRGGGTVSGCGSCTSTTCSSSIPLRGRVMVVAQAGERPPARGYTVKMQRQRRGTTNNTEALVRTAQSLSRQQPQVRLVPQQQQAAQQQQQQRQELFGGTSNSRQQPDASTSDRPDFAWPALPTGLGNWLDSIPARYRVVAATAVCFAICNMDKVNMSVAIIPMAQYFGWSASVSGLVQSSFFYGFLLTQLPGGYLSSKIGGRRVLPAGAALWSLATCAVPLIGNTVPGLCVSRAAVGFGEAVAPSAAIDMVSRIMPADERARSVSAVFSGLHVGTIVGLLTAPWLIQHLGWQAVFYIYGGLGLVWTMMFEAMMASIQRTEPDLVAALEGDKSKMVSATAGTSLAAGAAGSTARSAAQQPAAPVAAYGDKPSGNVPWRAFLRCAPLRNLAFVHFCNQWPTYTLMAWLPTYLVDTLSVDLMHAAQTSLLPPMAAIAASATAGPAADSLIRKGLPVGLVRKCAQGIAFLGPAACLSLATTPAVADVPALTVAALTAAIGLGAFSLAGLYCTHGDLSAKYASVLLGLTKTPACLPGIFGVTLVGYLYDQTQSWELSLFAPAIFFTTLGAFVYTFACSNDPVDFDEADNSPFAFESRLPSWLRFGGEGNKA